MKEQWVKLKAWWASLAVREQKAITFGGALLGIFIIYQFMWSPFANHIVFLRQQIQSQQKTLVWMRATDKAIQQIENHSHNQHVAASPVALLSYLQNRINHAGLESQLSQLKQASNDSIEIHFQKVEFDKLIQLLTLALKEQSISISQLSVNAENTPGIVNADVLIVLLK